METNNGHTDLRAVESFTSLNAESESHSKGGELRLGTDDLLTVANDAARHGYRIRNVTLVDSRFKPLDPEAATYFSHRIKTKIADGDMDSVRQFLANEAQGTFVTTIELQSPKRDSITLERRGMLRVDDESREPFLSVLKKRFMSLL